MMQMCRLRHVFFFLGVELAYRVFKSEPLSDIVYISEAVHATIIEILSLEMVCNFGSYQLSGVVSNRLVLL